MLQARCLPDGGFGSYPSLPAQAGATAWAAWALAESGAPPDALQPTLAWLAARQWADGRVPLAPDQPETIWPTPIAVLAWTAARWGAERVERAARFLLNQTGRHTARRPDSPVGHDTALRGWPWILGTHSWVLPTSLCILALRRAGYGAHTRVSEAARMLLDRQLPSGGWNYGNTTVFGQVLRPLPDTTGAALCALTGLTERDAVLRSLSYLRATVGRIRTPFSLGWALLGLASWEAVPSPAEAQISEVLLRQSHSGPYETGALAALLLASCARQAVGRQTGG